MRRLLRVAALAKERLGGVAELLRAALLLEQLELQLPQLARARVCRSITCSGGGDCALSILYCKAPLTRL